MSKVSTPTDVARALSRYRPLRPVITEAGPPPRRRAWPVTQRYAYLVRSIVYQQLAGSAAQAILARVEAQLPAQYSPTDVLAALDGPLSEVGLSGAKRRAIGDLSEKVLDGTIDLARHGRRSDAEIVFEVTSAWGVGPWTVQMYLMSALARPDVWPSGDYGVRMGWSLLHDLDEPIGAAELAAAADHLAPYRSTVAWYCWRAVDLRRENAG